jgi:hypothetical protein
MTPDLLQLESSSYGDLLGQIRYWKNHGYDLVSGTFRYHRKYVVLMQKRVDHKPARLVVSIGRPTFK